MPEKFPSPEFSVEEQELISALKERFDDPLTKELFVRWIEGREKEADTTDTARANLEISLQQARIYEAAGRLDEAWEEYQDLKMGAVHNEENADLFQIAQEGLERLKI